ncbi:hypothetical protein Leryth_002409 [Lithospermum erythrorhizon]|nr:hypothetical protein Leryth_002409 [Lithospermum erythrorhizon]
MVREFEGEWKPEMSGYSRKLVEFCCSKALVDVCGSIEERISDGSFSRFTFNMMLAWETPSSDYQHSQYTECIAKESEDKEIIRKKTEEADEISLFYSDAIPLLVDGGASAGEDAFLWLGTLVPLACDVANGRFTYETLTATTGNRLHFPAYDKFLKEIDKCIKHLQKQATPTGVEFADDEFILHVEGTTGSQRVVRHIGGTSWPGRLTVTNYALYFEASGALYYEDALKLDLSKNIEQSVKPCVTGPWGAALFDKAILYESSELKDGVVLEFPEMTSSTRRDHWLFLVKEIMFLHQFLLKFKVESQVEAWEMHARTILGIIRLHAARELLRLSPPEPKNFVIFALYDELPKGDYVLQGLAESLKTVSSAHPCSASSILRSLNVSQVHVSCAQTAQVKETTNTMQTEDLSSLESLIGQTREEAKEINVAKTTAEGLKEEGISESIQVLTGLLKPLKRLSPWLQDIFTWKRPASTFIVLVCTLLIAYNEWIGKAIAIFLSWMSAQMLRAKKRELGTKINKLTIYTGSDQTTMESIVSAQQGLRSAHEFIQQTNIAILKVWSIISAKAPKHAEVVMIAMVISSVILAIIPFKFVIMAGVCYGFAMTSKLGKHLENEQGNRRLKEWWDSIPVVPVEVVDKNQLHSST